MERGGGWEGGREGGREAGREKERGMQAEVEGPERSRVTSYSSHIKKRSKIHIIYPEQYCVAMGLSLLRNELFVNGAIGVTTEDRWAMPLNTTNKPYMPV